MSVAVIVICVLAASVVLFLNRQRPELAMLLSAAAGVTVLAYVLSPAVEILEELKNRLDSVGLSAVFSVLLKVIGICYLTEFAAELCRDFGQTSLAGKVELVGKVAIAALCLPLVDSLLEITEYLIG